MIHIREFWFWFTGGVFESGHCAIHSYTACPMDASDRFHQSNVAHIDMPDACCATLHRNHTVSSRGERVVENVAPFQYILPAKSIPPPNLFLSASLLMEHLWR